MSERLLLAANHIAKDLDIKTPKITFSLDLNTCFQTSGALGFNWVNFININFVQLDRMSVSYIYALAHEMRHLWQFRTGIMKIKRNFIEWDGELFPTQGDDLAEHNLLPQEQDANAYAERYIISLISKSDHAEQYVLPILSK